MMKQLIHVIDSNANLERQLNAIMIGTPSNSGKDSTGGGNSNQQIVREYKTLMDTVVPVMLNLMNTKMASATVDGILHLNETQRF
jgi:hypothetical protein